MLVCIPRSNGVLGSNGGLCSRGQLLEQNRKGRADPPRRADPQLAAMAVDDILHDGEAEASAAFLSTGCGIDTVEPLRETRQMLRCNAGAIVHDRNRNPWRLAQRARLSCQPDLLIATFPSVLDGGLHQVLAHLDQLLAIP